MGPVDAVRVCFAKYTDFTGRATRSEFWWFGGFILGGMIVLFLVDTLLFGGGFMTGNYALAPLSELFVLATVLPGWAVGVRRMQDVGQNGRTWFWLLGAIYVASYATTLIDMTGAVPQYQDTVFFMAMALCVILVVIAHIVVAVKPSQNGDNAYGAAPVAGAA